LERATAGLDADYFGAEQTHSKNIQLLSSDLFGAHVDDAVQFHQRTHGSARHAVLSRARFGDDSSLAHSPREQGLPDRVVNFVSAGVAEVFALEIDSSAAEMIGQSFGKEQRSRPAYVAGKQVVQLLMKPGIVLCDIVGGGQLLE